MADFRTALRDAARTAFCSVVSSTAAIDALLREFTGAPFTVQGEVANFLTRWVCNRENTNTPTDTGANFTGGQCPVRYTVTVTYYPVGGQWRAGTQPANSDPRTAQAIVWGPVGSVKVVLSSSTASPPEKAFRIEVVCRGSAPQPFSPVSPTPVIVTPAFQQVTTGANSNVLISSVTVNRVDGLADNCGDPNNTPPPPPANWNRVNTNIVYQNSNGVNLTVPVGFIFAPILFRPTLQLEIPFTIEFNPTVNFEGTLNLNSGDININFNPTFTNQTGDETRYPRGDDRSDNQPDNYDFDTQPPPPPDDDRFDDKEPPPDPTQEKVIRAVCVTANSVDNAKASVIYQTGGNPDIKIPEIGFVSFLIRVNRSVFWTNDIPVKSDRAFIPCPWVGGAIDVKGTPRLGISWELTPVYERSGLTAVE